MKLHLLIALTALSGTLSSQVYPDKIPGRYAHNGLEKICLRLEENHRFEMFTSTCTMDDQLIGSWSLRADTIVLNSDVQPRIVLLEAYPGADTGVGLQLELSLSDPALASSMTVTGGGFERKPVMTTSSFPAGAESLLFEIEGMDPLEYKVPDGTGRLRLRLGFENLSTSYLRDEYWKVDGRTLHFLPGPHSNVLPNAVAVKRGKKCFYKDQ